MEMAFLKMKSMLRKLALRTVDSLLEGIDEAIDTMTADDAKNAVNRSRQSQLRTAF